MRHTRSIVDVGSMVEVAEVLDGGAITDSEGALLERLRPLADEKQAHKKTLEAAKSLIQRRRDLDELIAAVLQDALALDGKWATVEEELQELQTQKETLRQTVEDVVDALQTQLARVASSLKGVLDLLSNASASLEELQSEVSSLVGHLDKVAEESWDGEMFAQLGAEFEGREEESTSGVRHGQDMKEASVGEVKGQITSPPMADTLHATEEAVLGRTDFEDDKRDVIEGSQVPELLPGQSWFSGTPEDSKPSVEDEEPDEPKNQARSPWWFPTRW